jgi:hypothetical protein
MEQLAKTMPTPRASNALIVSDSAIPPCVQCTPCLRQLLPVTLLRTCSPVQVVTRHNKLSVRTSVHTMHGYQGPCYHAMSQLARRAMCYSYHYGSELADAEAWSRKGTLTVCTTGG